MSLFVIQFHTGEFSAPMSKSDLESQIAATKVGGKIYLVALSPVGETKVSVPWDEIKENLEKETNDANSSQAESKGEDSSVRTRVNKKKGVSSGSKSVGPNGVRGDAGALS